jgi:hypothetical protein
MQGLNNQSIRHFYTITATLLLAAFTMLTSIYSEAEQDALLIQAENMIRQADYKAFYELLGPLDNMCAGDINMIIY